MNPTEALPGRAWSSSRAFRGLAIVAYCIALLLGLDFIYSNFFCDEDILARIYDPQYHHGFAPNFAGHNPWGMSRPPFYTDSMGFKDGSVREVPLVSATRRILLIGDSITEAIGLSFEDSFAGMLQQLGQNSAPKIEFLNAGVASYSPSIYYKKVKSLIEQGLQVNEVVVFSDLSDVFDEATGYFCIDDDPRYFAYCRPEDIIKQKRIRKKILQRNLVIMDKLIPIIKVQIRLLRTGGKIIPLSESDTPKEAGWTLSGYDVGNAYAPLGVEGGIARSLQNMRKLADLLKQRGIALTIAVYPWAPQLAHDDRDSRQVAIWRDFCAENCKGFIDLFPAFFAEKDAHEGWYGRLFIAGDIHFSAAGNRLIFREVAKRLM
jgi:lysophospholipase L1-like esterase